MGLELNLKPHVYERDPRQANAFRLTKIQPYMRLGFQDEVLFIQGGHVFHETGGPIPMDELPAWFKTEIEKASKVSLRECGWKA